MQRTIFVRLISIVKLDSFLNLRVYMDQRKRRKARRKTRSERLFFPRIDVPGVL